MQATISKKSHEGKIRNNRKDNAFTHQYQVITNELEAPITVRIYSTQARNYACVWINDSKKQIHLSGGAFAGGYGYHRPSAALEVALEDAGIHLSSQIAGVGEQAMKDALLAVAKALGYKKAQVFVAHA